jgi:hypothetical protein
MSYIMRDSVEDKLIEDARELIGIQDPADLVIAALKEMIAREAGRRLAKLGGTQPKLKKIPRRRFA